MRLFTFFILGVLSFSVKTASSELGRKVEVAEIAHTIGTLQPKLGQNRDKLALAIWNNSQKTGIDWRLAVAIFYQESSLTLDPQNCLKTNKCNDLGIGQVRYSVWGRELKIDKTKMLTDVNYAVSKSFDVLHYYKSQYADRELNWYTRYHSRTPEHRALYQHRLNHAYSKINSVRD